MEYFTLFSEGITPEVAVLVRAALIGALLFGCEALSSARRKVVRQEGKRAERLERERAKKVVKV